MKFSQSKIRQGMGEMQSLHNWWFTMTKSPQGLTWNEQLSMRVTTTGLPKPEVTRTEGEVGGFKMRGVGKVDRSGSTTVTFLESTDAKVMEFIQKMMQLQSSQDGKDTQGKAKKTVDNNFECQIQQLGPDDQPTQTWKLVYCLGKLSDNGGELGQSPDSQKPVLEIEFDDHHWGPGTSVVY